MLHIQHASKSFSKNIMFSFRKTVLYVAIFKRCTIYFCIPFHAISSDAEPGIKWRQGDQKSWILASEHEQVQCVGDGKQSAVQIATTEAIATYIHVQVQVQGISMPPHYFAKLEQNDKRHFLGIGPFCFYIHVHVCMAFSEMEILLETFFLIVPTCTMSCSHTQVHVEWTIFWCALYMYSHGQYY